MYKRVIGPYRVEEYLGRGGMAEVFRCSTTGVGGLDNTVVVKRVLPELVTEPELVQMFLEEARLVRYLDHPNIVVFFDIDHDDSGIPFISMEYIHGPTLLQVVHRAAQVNRRHFGCIVRIIRVIAEALEYVHTAKGPDGQSLGIVHRDVTPQNILVPPTGIPKLIDFGIAKSFLATSRTHTGILKGKVGFVAPEQINSGPVDARTDVFSLGVTLFRATTGEMPFEGRTQQQRLDAVVRGNYRRPRDLIPTYPRTLEDVVVRAIQPDPDDRFSSAAEFADAVGSCIGLSSLNDTQAIGYWIRELFPNEDWRVSSVDAGVSMSSGRIGYRMTNSSVSSISAGTSTRRAITGSEHHYVPTTMIGQALAPVRLSVAQQRRKIAANIVGILLAVVTMGMVVNLEAGREIVFSLLSVQASNDEELLSYLEEIERLEGQGQLSLALEMLEQVQRIPTSNPKLGVWRARIVASMRSPEGRKNRNLALFLDEAESLMASERYRAALSMVEEAKQIETDDPRLTIRRNRVEEEARKGSLLAQALLDLHSGEVDAAEDKAKQILAIDYQHEAAKLLLQEISERSRASTTNRPKKRNKASLSITSDPPGAVYISGRYIGSAPVVAHTLTPGTHRVEIRVRGYKTSSQEVRLVAGEVRAVRLKLDRFVEPKPSSNKKKKEPKLAVVAATEVEEPVEQKKPEKNYGTLQVMSKPAGFVYVNNKILGKTPVLDYRLPTGTYKLEIRNSDHFAEMRSFQVGPGEVKVFDVELRPIGSALNVGSNGSSGLATGREPLHNVDDKRPPAKELPTRWRVTQRRELKRIIGLVSRDLVGQSQYSEVQLEELFAPLEDSLAEKLEKSNDIRIFPRAMYYLALESTDKYQQVDKAARFLLHRYHL